LELADVGIRAPITSEEFLLDHRLLSPIGDRTFTGSRLTVSAEREGQKNKNKQNEKTEAMKINKNLAFATLAATLLFQTSITQADDRGSRGDDRGQRGDDNERGDRDHRDHRDHGAATVDFTKWRIPPFPLPPEGGILVNMVGVIVGGDVGDGTFTGEVLSSVVDPVTGFNTTEAVYHFHGSKHSFTARIQAVQEVLGIGQKGVITGVVTDGWLKGHAVEGEWTVIPACYAPGTGLGNCFEVTLEIERDRND